MRITAFVLRFVNNLKSRNVSQHDNNELTGEETGTLGRGELFSAENAAQCNQSCVKQDISTNLIKRTKLTLNI